MSVDLGDLRGIRKALGKSQSQMAALLGVSTRAIQSYEQGWRTPPATVLKLAAYMLYLKRSGPVSASCPPCWEVRHCDPAERVDCFASQIGEGHCCWLVTGNACGKKTFPSWPAKLAHCRGCPVIRRWLDRPRSAAAKATRATGPGSAKPIDPPAGLGPPAGPPSA